MFCFTGKKTSIRITRVAAHNDRRAKEQGKYQLFVAGDQPPQGVLSRGPALLPAWPMPRSGGPMA